MSSPEFVKRGCQALYKPRTLILLMRAQPLKARAMRSGILGTALTWSSLRMGNGRGPKALAGGREGVHKAPGLCVRAMFIDPCREASRTWVPPAREVGQPRRASVPMSRVSWKAILRRAAGRQPAQSLYCLQGQKAHFVAR